MDNNTLLLLIIGIYFVMQICKSKKNESFTDENNECKNCIDNLDEGCTKINEWMNAKNILGGFEENFQKKLNDIDNKIKEINNLWEEDYSKRNNLDISTQIMLRTTALKGLAEELDDIVKNEKNKYKKYLEDYILDNTNCKDICKIDIDALESKSQDILNECANYSEIIKN